MKIVAALSPGALAILVAAAPAHGLHALRADSARSELPARVAFSRALDIYNWQLRAAYARILNPRITFRFGENFLSSLHRLRSNDKWRDDQNASIDVDFPAFGASAQARLYSRIFRDQISFFNSDQQSSGAQIRWRELLWNRLEIQPGAGYRWESRLDQPDHGPQYELETRLPESHFGGYSHQLEAAGAIERFPSRKNEDLRFNYGLSRQFYADTSDSLFLKFAHFRRDNYFSEGGQIRIEQLSKRTRGIENRLHYRLSERGRLALRSVLQENRVAIGTALPDQIEKKLGERSYEDFEVQNVLMLDWQGSQFAAGVEFLFHQQTLDSKVRDSTSFSPATPRFGLVRNNFHDRTFSIAPRFRWQPSSRDSLGLSGSVARFARDTSEKRRPDSYDRLRAHFALTHQHHFRRGLTLRWQLSAYADHLVYLKSAFSATNNWTRILQLAPQVLFQASEAVQTSQRVGVRAHYVTYDFEDIPGTPKSFSSRTFFVNDSLFARLSSRSTLAVNYNLELEEIGSLNWDEFTTRPQVSRVRHWFFLSFDHALASRWRLSPGVNFYGQTQWNHESTARGIVRRRAGHLTTLGPQLRLTYERAPHALLYFHGQQQIVFSAGAKRQTQYYFNLTVQWSL